MPTRQLTRGCADGRPRRCRAVARARPAGARGPHACLRLRLGRCRGRCGGRAALAEFGGTNGLDPTAFPSILAMEQDLVAFARDLLHGPETTVGTATSGGTESILMAVLAARDASPRGSAAAARPSMGVAKHRARGLPQGRALLRGPPGRRRRRSGSPYRAKPGGLGARHRRHDDPGRRVGSLIRPRRHRSRPGHRGRGGDPGRAMPRGRLHRRHDPAFPRRRPPLGLRG
jgi:hypothetical protein